MDATGNGENGNETAQASTVASSRPSRVKGSHSTKRTVIPTTPAAAAAILQSALTYCRKANLKVRWYSKDGSLILSISGLELRDGEIVTV